MEKMVNYGRILMSKYVVIKYAICIHLCCQVLDALIPLNNPVIITVFIIWITCVLWKIVLWPYVNYYIVLKDYSAWDAVIKSMSLALSNLWLTLRGLLRQAVIRCRFLINSCIAIWIPVIIMVFFIQMDIINNATIEIISWILVSFWLLVFIYLEAVFTAFDYTYRYKIFLEAERRSNLK